MKNRVREEKFGKFNDKINSLEKHPRYGFLRKYADDAIRYYDNFGTPILQIKAEDFVNRIIAFDEKYISDWLDGKNKLEW